MAAEGLRAVQRRHGNDAVATYFGNPSAHTMAVLPGLTLRHVLETRNHYSATSADQLPQHLTSAEMFGNLALFPIPDVDRTDYMLVLGANPSVSNGSLMTAPGARHRLRAIVARGGTVVVVDPRRTETASLASSTSRSRRAAILPAARHAARPVRGGPDEPRLARGPRGRPRRRRGARRRLAGRPRRAGCRRRSRDDRTARARVRRSAARRRVRPRRRLPPAHRLGDALADQRAQRGHRQPRHARRRDVPQPGVRRRQAAALRPAAGLRRSRALHAARERTARDERRAAGRRPGRRDPHRGRRAGPRDVHLRRQPGAVDAGRRRGSTRRWRRSSSASRSIRTSPRPPATPT